jgi:hypothetical protein
MYLKRKGQKNLGNPTKKQSFFLIKGLLFLSGTPNILGPSYFEAALLEEFLRYKLVNWGFKKSKVPFLC